LFVDGGNVYNRLEGIDTGELRYAAGVSLSWITPVGPLKFSYGRPLNQREGDLEENFQFTIGQP
ncbi:MAG: BamA/TamA family outer membrane protein, partial [Gammaproteobacteria bacterium]|nr:BamA/TamA family outer membrane protein [Gammaproteobacteria bacterium]